MTEHTDVYLSFDPFMIKVPPVERLTGIVMIHWPEMHLKLIDLSMNGAIPGAHIGSEGEFYTMNVDVGEEGISMGDFVKFITLTEDHWRLMYDAIQDRLKDIYILSGDWL